MKVSPLSLLSVMSQIEEKIIARRIQQQTEEIDILLKEHSGIRQQLFTEQLVE